MLTSFLKNRFFSLFLFLFYTTLILQQLSANEEQERREIIEAVKTISLQQQRLSNEIDKLKGLLGMTQSLGLLSPVEATEVMMEKTASRTKRGIKAFEEQEFEEAKELFQEAWEEEPEIAITNYNLGISYEKLGKRALAKKMLKAAVEIDSQIPNASKIRAFLNGKTTKKMEEKEEDLLTKEEEAIKTEMTNLKTEMESYLKSTELPAEEKVRLVVKTVEELIQKGEKHDRLVREFFLPLADSFSAYEMYDKALNLLTSYEKSMEGRVLPSDFHTKKLQIAERKKRQNHNLEGYMGNNMDSEVERKLSRDLRELEIFGEQMEQFVKDAAEEDSDFVKICKRLREYRWGNRPNRHVIVVNRYKKLLYSSLEGTLPIDRYRDNQGDPFLRNITLLADHKEMEKAEFFNVDLNVNGKVVPYVVMYTFIPKHEAFIIVRLPKKDLT